MLKMWKLLESILCVAFALDLIAAMYLKSQAIDEMHNPLLVKDPVVFTSLGGAPQISAHIAFYYHLAMWGAFLFPVLLAASGGLKRLLWR